MAKVSALLLFLGACWWALLHGTGWGLPLPLSWGLDARWRAEEGGDESVGGGASSELGCTLCLVSESNSDLCQITCILLPAHHHTHTHTHIHTHALASTKIHMHAYIHTHTGLYKSPSNRCGLQWYVGRHLPTGREDLRAGSQGGCRESRMPGVHPLIWTTCKACSQAMLAHQLIPRNPLRGPWESQSRSD